MSKKPKARYVTPTLESITIKGKYKIPTIDFRYVSTYLEDNLGEDWLPYEEMGNSVRFAYTREEKEFSKVLEKVRSGIPVDISVTSVESLADAMIIEVHCLPAMWHRIAKMGEHTFTENQVQEALFECQLFVKQIMSGLKGIELEPVSVYPIIPRAEIKSRLLNLGLKEIVEKMNTAERHVVQNNFSDSLKSSRTAFEKMIDWQMKKRGLEKTNSYTNDLERLKSKGYLDKDTAELLKSYYGCLSNIAVHEKGAPPGIYEAQMGYGITLIMLGYFADKLP